jgi:ubiquinol-cytochrome c reductase cytochrome c1 subunit
MMRALRHLLAAAMLAGVAAVPALAQDAPTPPAQRWSFDGPFGTFDLAAAQRGFQVYSEVCSVCHSMQYLHYRDLAGIGLTDEQIKGIAAEVTVPHGLDDQGNPKEGPGTPADAFKSHNGALPPDLSLIFNAREGHGDYIYAILTGYADPPPGVQMQDGMNYNKMYPGHQIAMPPPLTDGRVTYADGTTATVEQEARDVVTFLAWTANPEMVQRKQIGWRVVLYLLFMTGLTYAVKRKVWADVH